MISNNVTRASFDAIRKCIRRLNFLGPVNRAIEKLLTSSPAVRFARTKRNKLIPMSRVVNHLVNTLGGTWAAASQP
eukprot:3473822-Prymnesium_polylepis.1